MSHLTRRCTLHAGSTAATYTHKHTATLLGTAFTPVCCTALCIVTLHRTQYPRLYHAAQYALHARTQRNPLRRHPTHSATLHDLNHTTLRCAPFMCVHVSTHQPTERVTVRPHAPPNFTSHGTTDAFYRAHRTADHCTTSNFTHSAIYFEQLQPRSKQLQLQPLCYDTSSSSFCHCSHL